ncbi:MAG: bifunctional adenosylcobinamide kinase/adenosylcobinamide-phosphate guanylyltransferase [Anaerolineae bacterium]|nr:bifunctional adenosylcobinamide kinase/adenosylcobinamide-phosphate guanylyltransferase [Anaerolineae bacterium]
MGQLHFILGGARSGKSTFAQELACRMAGDDVLFVATAEASDPEMEARIRHHRSQRPPAWRTLEAPLHAGARVAEALTGSEKAILLDCLTLLVSNAIIAAGGEREPVAAAAAVEAEVEALLRCTSLGPHLIVVSNEVGLGLVPEYPLGRLYRDSLGRANQIVAERADRVYFLVAGIPVDLKRLADSLQGPSPPDPG